MALIRGGTLVLHRYYGSRHLNSMTKPSSLIALAGIWSTGIFAFANPAATRAYAGVYQVAKITDPAGVATDEFGCALAILGNRMFVGARSDDTFATDAGAVYIFDRVGDTWTMTDVLSPDVVQAGQGFGWSIAVDPGQPDLLIVGSPLEDGTFDREGAVYVFAGDGMGGYTQVARLHPGGLPDNSQFGEAVAIDGSTLIAGAPFESNFIGAYVGDAYLFERDLSGFWYQTQEIFPSVAPSGAIFGTSVAIEGDLVAVGAPYLGFQFVGGAEFVFAKDPTQGWLEQQRLLNPTTSGRTRYGTSSAISGGVVVVGGPRDTPPPIGEVVSYDQDEFGVWNPIQPINAPDYLAFDRFGNALAIDGARMAVGAFNQSEVGAVYLYDFDAGNMTFSRKIQPSDLSNNDQFGGALVLSGDTLAVGAIGQDGDQPDEGAVYVFSITDEPLGDVNCDGVVNLSDVSHFVEAMLNPVDYEADHDGDPFPVCDRFLADMNRSATVNGLDVEAFILAIVGP